MYESFALNGSVGAELAGGELRATGTWYREDYGSEWSGDGSQGIGNFAPVVPVAPHPQNDERSEEHTSELQSLMRISYAVFCLKKKKTFIIRLSADPSDRCNSSLHHESLVT